MILCFQITRLSIHFFFRSFNFSNLHKVNMNFEVTWTLESQFMNSNLGLLFTINYLLKRYSERFNWNPKRADKFSKRNIKIFTNRKVLTDKFWFIGLEYLFFYTHTVQLYHPPNMYRVWKMRMKKKTQRFRLTLTRSY